MAEIKINADASQASALVQQQRQHINIIARKSRRVDENCQKSMRFVQNEKEAAEIGRLVTGRSIMGTTPHTHWHR